MIIEFALQLSLNDEKNFPTDPSNAVDYADKWIEHLYMCKKPLPMPEYIMINKSGAFDINVRMMIPSAPKKPFYAYPKGATAEEKNMIRDEIDRKHSQDLEEHATQVTNLLHHQRLADKEISKNGLRHAVMKIVHNLNNNDPLPGSMCTQMYTCNRVAAAAAAINQQQQQQQQRRRKRRNKRRIIDDDDDQQLSLKKKNIVLLQQQQQQRS